MVMPNNILSRNADSDAIVKGSIVESVPPLGDLDLVVRDKQPANAMRKVGDLLERYRTYVPASRFIHVGLIRGSNDSSVENAPNSTMVNRLATACRFGLPWVASDGGIARVSASSSASRTLAFAENFSERALPTETTNA